MSKTSRKKRQRKREQNIPAKLPSWVNPCPMEYSKFSGIVSNLPPFKLTMYPDGEQFAPKLLRSRLISDKDVLSKYWTKLKIINGARLKKNRVLDIIQSAVAPHFILPVMYQEEGEDTFFIFRGGAQALSILSSKNLVLHDPQLGESIILMVQLQYLSIDEETYNFTQHLDSALTKRMNKFKSTVDLRSFNSDPELKDVYLNLHVNQFSLQVTTHLKRKYSHLTTFILSYNELENMEIVDAIRKTIQTVKIIDLRHNNIPWSIFEKDGNVPGLEELYLEGNPLCSDFQSATEMIREVKRVVPHLKKLDAVDVSGTMFHGYVAVKTYLKNSCYAPFVDHFLHHYFTSLQSDRSQLAPMYHPEAWFSLSVMPPPNAASNTWNPFLVYNRNILGMSDVRRSYDKLAVGSAHIVSVLQTLPPMKFDQYSFTVDVPVIAKTDLILISTTGLFVCETVTPRGIFSFSRTFILTPNAKTTGEWKITNDMWYVTNASKQGVEKLFSVPSTPLKSDFAVMVRPDNPNKDILVRIFQKPTTLKSAWAQKLLSESSWDLERALQSFVDQYKTNMIPPEAFNS